MYGIVLPGRNLLKGRYLEKVSHFVFHNLFGSEGYRYNKLIQS